jgi:hypothetical protein
LRLTVGWLARKRRAAPVKLRVSATATNVLHKSQSMEHVPGGTIPMFKSGKPSVQD